MPFCRSRGRCVEEPARGLVCPCPAGCRPPDGSPGRLGAFPQPSPAILISRHHARAARRARPRAHATLQSEAEGAWCDRLSSDLLWRGLSQLDRAKIGDQKQAARACYAARHFLFERQPPRTGGLICANFNRRLVVLRQSIVAPCQFCPRDSPGSFLSRAARAYHGGRHSQQ
jgi:hypothetical protein